MISSAAAGRRALATAAFATALAFAAGCSSGTSTSTVTVSAPPGSSPGSPPTSTPAGPPTTPAGPAECTTAGLRVSVKGAGAAAGTDYATIDFTNSGASACFVRGYPGVSLVSAGSNAGSQIGADAKRDPTVPSTLITLAPGQTAHALLAVIDAVNYPPAKCQPVAAHWLKVFPPDQFAAAFVRFTTKTCASTSQPTMRIQRVKSGA
jgi:hypothetical protein